MYKVGLACCRGKRSTCPCRLELGLGVTSASASNITSSRFKVDIPVTYFYEPLPSDSENTNGPSQPSKLFIFGSGTAHDDVVSYGEMTTMLRLRHPLTRQDCEKTTAVELDVILEKCCMVHEACTQSGATPISDFEERARAQSIRVLELDIVRRGQGAGESMTLNGDDASSQRVPGMQRLTPASTKIDQLTWPVA